MHSTPFPTVGDLPNLDPIAARAALEQLRRRCQHGAAEVYLAPPSLPGAPQHWYVRLLRTGQRIPLEQWAGEWLKTWRKPPKGGGPGPSSGGPATPYAVDRSPGYTARADPEEAQANARTIAQIPGEQLPWPAVRAALIYRALAGLDCYAYEHRSVTFEVLHGEPQGVWVIWDRQPNPWEEARFTPREWAVKHGFQVDGPDDGGTAA